MPKAGDLVRVTWLDAFWVMDPKVLQDLPDGSVTETVGTLLLDRESSIVLAGETVDVGGEDQKPRDVTIIPRVLVAMVETLEVSSPRRHEPSKDCWCEPVVETVPPQSEFDYQSQLIQELRDLVIDAPTFCREFEASLALERANQCIERSQQ